MRMVHALALAALVVAGPSGAPAPSLPALIESYASGAYDDAIRQIATEDVGRWRVSFVRDVPGWIRSEPDRMEARRAAAASFLLEASQARLESDWGRLADLIEFTCADLRAGRPPSEFELAWHRASIALAGRARARLWLLGEFAVLPHQTPVRRPQTTPEKMNPKHLLHALERFPDDPQLQLARIVAWTWGRDNEPTRNEPAFFDDFPPSSARANAPREAIRALEALVENPVVGTEAYVRIAQMEIVAKHPESALRAARHAELATSAAVRYLALYLSARALEALDRPDEAVVKYKAALSVVPRADSATLGLASLQFVRDDRANALGLIRQTFDQPSVLDPARLIGYGSFLHWTRLRDAMRAQLTRSGPGR